MQRFHNRVDFPIRQLRLFFRLLLFQFHADQRVGIGMVNHASELIHKIYQREKVEDVAQWWDAVRFAA